MSDQLEKRAPLRDRIEEIVAEEMKAADPEKVTYAHILTKRIMWRSGHEVLKDYPELAEEKERRGRGGALISFQSVGEEVGRDKGTIKRWVEMGKVIGPDEDDFETWAIGERQRYMGKWAVSLMKSREPLQINTVEVPPGKFSVIYADPPWEYDDKAMSEKRWAGAENHYPCMSVDELKDLRVNDEPVEELAADDAVLLLWVTFPFLEDVFSLFEPWGFEYKTCAFTWVKTNADDSIYMGLGNYTRGNAELCLLGRRGGGPERLDAGVHQVELHSRLGHSEKPDVFRERIEQLFGDVPRLELFARKERPGWATWGNQMEVKDGN